MFQFTQQGGYTTTLLISTAIFTSDSHMLDSLLLCLRVIFTCLGRSEISSWLSILASGIRIEVIRWFLRTLWCSHLSVCFFGCSLEFLVYLALQSTGQLVNRHWLIKGLHGLALSYIQQIALLELHIELIVIALIELGLVVTAIMDTRVLAVLTLWSSNVSWRSKYLLLPVLNIGILKLLNDFEGDHLLFQLFLSELSHRRSFSCEPSQFLTSFLYCGPSFLQLTQLIRCSRHVFWQPWVLWFALMHF